MQPSPPPHRQPIVLAVVATLTVHLAALLGMLLLPTRETTPEQRPPLDVTEITLIDPVMLDRPDPPPQEAAPTEPVPPSEAPAAEAPDRRAPPPRTTPDSPAPQADAPATPELPASPASPDAPAGAAPQPGSGLLKLRGTGVPRPSSLRPSVVMPKTPPKALPPKVGPALPPSKPRTTDREPRSLAEAGFKPRGDGTYRYRDPTQAFKAVLHPNGRVEFKFKASQLHRLGLNDALLAGSGPELFQRAKKELLANTFELRMNMATGWAEAQMKTQLKQLSAQLLSTWKQSGVPGSQRRMQIFELWDECEESFEVDAKGVDAPIESRLDKARAKAGNKARAKIVEFIGRHLPETSKDAYARAELDKLNRKRHSRQRFEPYGKPKKRPTPPPAPEPG